MKKSLIALAAVAASGFAMAQSSVTVFGVLDAAVTVYDGVDTVTSLGNSGNSSARLGFRGVEDLGSGLKAGFHIEGAVSNDDGSGVGGGAAGPGFEFKRRSTLSLMGSFGEVRLGRNLTAAYSATSRYDNFGTVGVGGSGVWNDIGGVRRDNMITFQSGDFGGFKFAVDYALGETAANLPSGDYWGAAATYDNGPLSVGASYFDQTAAALNAADRDGWSVGAAYNFGVVKLAGAFQHVGLGNRDYDNYLVALSAPVGSAGEAKFSYNRYDNDVSEADQYALGYVHALSKRTALYGTYAYLKNKNNGTYALGGSGFTKSPADKGKVQAVQVGVRHAF